MVKSNKRSNYMSRAAREIEEALEGVLSNREMAFELLDAVLDDDELTAADMFLCGELRVACMMMYRHLDTLRSYQKRAHKLFTDSSAELFNALIDGLGESCEEILGFEALLAGTFSASLRHESPYAAEEQYLEEFMDTEELTEEPDEAEDSGYVCDDELRDMLRGLLSKEGLGGGCDCGKSSACPQPEREGYGGASHEGESMSGGDSKVDIKLVCGADVPERFEQLLKRGIEQAIHDTARAYRSDVRRSNKHR